MKLPGVMIVPGLYDDDGELHLDAAEYCEGHGIPVNPYNVAMVERLFTIEIAARYPGVPITEVD